MDPVEDVEDEEEEGEDDTGDKVDSFRRRLGLLLDELRVVRRLLSQHQLVMFQMIVVEVQLMLNMYSQ